MKNGRGYADSTSLFCLHAGSFDFVWHVHHGLFLNGTYYAGTWQIPPKAINKLLVLEWWLIGGLSFPNFFNQQLRELGTFMFEVEFPKQSFCSCTQRKQKSMIYWAGLGRNISSSKYQSLKALSKLHHLVENLCGMQKEKGTTGSH